MEHFASRRYLVSFGASNLLQRSADVLVIGSGVAGMRAALAAASHGSVLLIAKGRMDESNTSQAQGGIAAAMAPTDSTEAHMADTLATGQGVCNENVVQRVTQEAPERINELIAWGGTFDSEGDGLALAREGGHSTARIVHAFGDATGREVSTTLLRRVRATPGIQPMPNVVALDLIVEEGEGCLGALIHDARHGLMIVWAQQTILATGGAGRIFRETTNPAIATGDGVAMAYRAGADLCDVEFYQFHPTALYVAGASRALISEAVRGEGGLLLKAKQERFMPRYHERADLAPRDVVSRAIVNEIRETGHTCAYLDVRHLPADYFRRRFPGICDLCAQFDIDITRELVPIRPAAHYMVGGVRVDADGASSVPRLWVCGEAACTGLHGANRLGSNSLLEGLVFGFHAGDLSGRAAAAEHGQLRPLRLRVDLEQAKRYPIDVGDVTNSLRAMMWRNVGIERSGFHLDEAIHMMQFWGRYVLSEEFDRADGWELQNMLLLTRLVAEGARLREESRGVHFRTDFPDAQPEWRRHIIFRNGEAPRFTLSAEA